MSKKIWEYDLYKANVPFIIDGTIVEYDISKANISILMDAGCLSEELYARLYNSNKMERQISIGKLQGKNPNLSLALSEGLQNARKKFIEMNNFNTMNIIDIRKDSISIYGTQQATQFQISDHVSFRVAGNYTSLYRLGFIDIYYLYDVITGQEIIDPRGLGKSKELHKDYMLDFLSELFYVARAWDGPKKALELLKNFNEKYINRDLAIGFYREFNPQSMYKLNYSDFSSMYADMLLDAKHIKKDLDISFNANILRELVKYYSSVYFRK